MPRYNLRIGGRTVPIASTEKPLSTALGKRLAGATPETNVDSTSGGHKYQFGGQELSFEDLRDIKDMRDSGGQVAQLMKFKALLNFGEGAELHVEDDEETEQVVDGTPMTLCEWLETEAFPTLDLLVLELGEDALWYPAAYGELRETRGGDFGEALPAEPWTILPKTDEKGEVAAYVQRTKAPSGGYTEQTIDPTELWSIVLNKASARDKTGISEVLRNEDEIRAFKENEQAINQAIELHGFPQRHVKVGREEGAPVSDDDLRRVRTIFDPRTTDANTAYFTGQDVNVDTLEAHQFDYTAIHEMDMRNLTTALGLPLEAGNVGSDGLGSGKPAELRFSLLKLAIQANQRSFGVQFTEEIIRPVVRDYSPFDHTATITVDIGDPLEDIGDMADVIAQIGDYMTNDEIRRKLDMPEPEDDEIGESYRSPADIERDEEGVSDQEGPFGGMFEDHAREAVESELTDRQLADPMANGHDMDPGTGEVTCSNADDSFVIEDATFNDLAEDCPLCGEPLSHVDDSQLSDGETDFRHGVLEHAPEWDRPLLEMYRGVTDPESDSNRALVSFSSSGTPEFVLERIREAVDSGAIFSDIDGVSGGEIMEFRSEFKDALATDDFTLEDVTEVVADFTGEDTENARVAARTELGNTLKHAREDGYEERGEDDELFYWTGADPGDERQTDVCGYLIAGQGGHLENPGAFSGLDHSQGTNPYEGGDPLPMDELKDLVEAAARADPEVNTEPRTWTPHIQCRSTFVKAPPET